MGPLRTDRKSKMGVVSRTIIVRLPTPIFDFLSKPQKKSKNQNVSSANDSLVYDIIKVASRGINRIANILKPITMSVLSACDFDSLVFARSKVTESYTESALCFYWITKDSSPVLSLFVRNSPRRFAAKRRQKRLRRLRRGENQA